MKIRITISLILSAVIMFLSQFLTIKYVAGNDGLGVLLLLFFVLYPIVSVIIGIINGKYFKKLFFIPILNGVIYLAAAWTFLEFLETAFIVYALAYIGIGVLAAFITYIITNKNSQSAD